MPTATQCKIYQRMGVAVHDCLHDLKKAAASDIPLKLNIGRHARSRKMVEIIHDTDETLRTAFLKYMVALNRIIARHATLVKVKRKALKKYFAGDRTPVSDETLDELVDGWIIDDSMRQQLKQQAGVITDEMRRGLLEILALSQQQAYEIGLGEIDGRKIQQQDENNLREEHRQQEHFIIAFLQQIRNEYHAVIDGNLEYTGQQYVYESEAELRRRFVEIGDTSIARLDLYAIAAPESAMIAGISQAGMEAGIMGGVWNTMDDNVVCPDCRALDGHWMTFKQFRQNYKSTLCDGRCRCGEQFEPTNDTSQARYGVWAEY